MSKIISICAALVIFCSLQSCRYGFKSTTGIAPSLNTFLVDVFDVEPRNAPVIIGQDFSNLLTDKIRRESRLDPVDTDPDIEFEGAITQFEITYEAPQPGESTAFNRLNMTIRVEYTDNQDEERSWERPENFSFFFDFASDANLIDIQDEAINAIFDQMVEDVFNKAFTNW
jgi:hypothetical protein